VTNIGRHCSRHGKILLPQQTLPALIEFIGEDLVYKNHQKFVAKTDLRERD
jgi:hypothetical protein